MITIWHLNLQVYEMFMMSHFLIFLEINLQIHCSYTLHAHIINGHSIVKTLTCNHRTEVGSPNHQI